MRKIVPFELVDDDGNRTQFEITQMSATQQQSWIIRAALALGESIGATDISGDFNGFIRELSKRGIGIFAGLSYEKVQPLLDELLACCAHVTGKARLTCTPDTVDGYISDALALTRLEVESFKVSFDFFIKKLGKTERAAESPSASREVIRIPKG